ncbi:hypothetical protein SAMN05421832_103238 [Psychrobacillus psychrodurans]|nr:hypothetical protein [Psychrobacillus psychrodurans]SFM52917.1 hypothetical protein SAMN05421832_103238 [Psychrobacillus psychrodurans]
MIRLDRILASDKFFVIAFVLKISLFNDRVGKHILFYARDSTAIFVPGGRVPQGER